MAMIDTNQYRQEIEHSGFTVIDDVFSEKEVDSLLDLISKADVSKPVFRKTGDLFAIRQFLKEMPETVPIIFNRKLKDLIRFVFGDGYFIVKSIYFDKPPASNWFVAYHQDLTISVNTKTDLDGFGPWTVKQDQFAVQPPLSLLENNFTIRIHLDDTDHKNGALKVIPGSHQKGIYRPETIDWNIEKEVICPVSKGGVMIMKPLLLHASGRTINKERRRVIHMEFSNQHLPGSLKFSEKTIYSIN